MNFALFLLLSVVQGCNFNFGPVSKELSNQMSITKSRYLTVERTRQPVRRIGAPFEESSGQDITDPCVIQPALKKHRNVPRPRQQANPSECITHCTPNLTGEDNVSVSSNIPAGNTLKRSHDELVPSPSPDYIVNPRSFISFFNKELDEYNFHDSTLRYQVANVISLIYYNDLQRFNENESVFRSVFGYDCSKLERNGIPMVSYYIIYFGAGNFMDYFNSLEKSQMEWDNLLTAYLNLIETKNPKFFVKIIKLSDNLPERHLVPIGEAIKSKFPQFPHCLEDEILKELALKIALTGPVKDKIAFFINYMKILCHMPINQLSHLKFKRLLSLPVDAAGFFKSFDEDLKFLLAKIAVLHEDVDALTKIITLDSNVLMDRKGLDLFNLVVQKNKKKMIPLFVILLINTEGQQSWLTWLKLTDQYTIRYN